MDLFVRQTHSNDALAYGMTDLGLSFEPNFQMTDYVTGDSGDVSMVSDPNYDALFAQAEAATTLDAYKADLTAMNKEVAEQHFDISSVRLPSPSVSRGSRVTSVRHLRLTLRWMLPCLAASICRDFG